MLISSGEQFPGTEPTNLPSSPDAIDIVENKGKEENKEAEDENSREPSEEKPLIDVTIQREIEENYLAKTHRQQPNLDKFTRLVTYQHKTRTGTQTKPVRQNIRELISTGRLKE